MKHVRADQTFIYYYSTGLDGQLHGLRFSKGTVAPFRGESTDPETIAVGPVYQLPILWANITEPIHSAVGAVCVEHPEVLSLLLGYAAFATFEGALKTK